MEVQILEGRSVRVGQVRVDLGTKSRTLELLEWRSYKEKWEESSEVELALKEGETFG